MFCQVNLFLHMHMALLVLQDIPVILALQVIVGTLAILDILDIQVIQDIQVTQVIQGTQGTQE
ncbi:hypothetical protein EBX31_07465 [bacterium]|nr:hypothetical protein [bacterium]